MATVTIGKSYFDALLRKAEFHTSSQPVSYGTDLSENVTIGKAEHEYMSIDSQLQAVREYHLLKNALLRGGLTTETLETLLEGENGVSTEGPSSYDYVSDHTPATSRATPVKELQPVRHPAGSGHTAVSHGLQSIPSRSLRRAASHGGSESFTGDPDSPPNEDDEQERGPGHRVPLHDQRTVLITNLSERTTHKDLASIVRGGRVLDIFLRNDRSATISFVEGAAEFLAYAKRNDIYLHTKRLEFRWSDRQFHVPPHVSNKIAGGATRNLAVRGIAGKVTTDQIRDQLDHIHNLIVVDIYFRNGDAYISTNSIHNALFARTCMMSRSVYKGTRIEYYPDECAGPLPQPKKAYAPIARMPMKPTPVVNQYALLDTGSDDDSESEEESYKTHGVQVDGYHWADSVVV
ncbi:hypothetical protein G6011_11371 [Alternaria panax]|uniref:Negative regulator of differentiation 1 n=1 Tax=Alternaria panax TaxID=48097 RepID=A0AAD4NRP4_9PLEO|nr:hypothetical protein G6011_11371 [Alternaria panax]